MLEDAVLRVGTVGIEADGQAARGKIALGPDVVAGEKLDRASRRQDRLADPKAAISVKG